MTHEFQNQDTKVFHTRFMEKNCIPCRKWHVRSKFATFKGTCFMMKLKKNPHAVLAISNNLFCLMIPKRQRENGLL